MENEKKKMVKTMDEASSIISQLPEGCISHIISFTSPRDACRTAAVSKSFLSAMASDMVWENFLPADHEAIVARAVEPIVFKSKKELYFRLCDSILLDDGARV